MCKQSQRSSIGIASSGSRQVVAVPRLACGNLGHDMDFIGAAAPLDPFGEAGRRQPVGFRRIERADSQLPRSIENAPRNGFFQHGLSSPGSVANTQLDRPQDKT